MAFVLLALLALGSILIRHQRIVASVPYVNHYDEPILSEAAKEILVTGDLNPRFFQYPSLPIYLVSIGFAAGMLLDPAEEIGSVSYPHYTRRSVAWAARMLFALLSVGGLLLTGWIAYRVSGDLFLLVLAPVCLSLSSLYMNLSTLYLNVDIVGCFFVLCTLALVSSVPPAGASTGRVLALGALSGLSVASKYNLGTVGVSVLAMLLFQNRQRLRRDMTIAAFAAASAFLIAVPYALLDFPAFREGVLAEIHHYATGHLGFDGDPGLDQISFYLGSLAQDFGILSFGFALVGIVALVNRDWKRMVPVLLMPTSLLILMSLQRVRFERNLLSAYPVFAILVASGIVIAGRSVASRVSGLGRSAGTGLAVAVFLASLNWSRVFAAYDPIPDSRHRAARWIHEELPVGARLWVPVALGLDLRTLREDLDVMEVVDLREISRRLRDGDEGFALVPEFSHDPRREGGEQQAMLFTTALAMNPNSVLSSFGTKPLLVNYPQPAAWGNPRFHVVRLSKVTMHGKSAPSLRATEHVGYSARAVR